MKRLIWAPPTLAKVTGKETTFEERMSSKGTPYTAEVIPKWELITVGSATEKKDKDGNTKGYSYEVYDPVQDIGGFSITVPVKANIKLMQKVVFKKVYGGALPGSTRGWYKADSVEPL